MQRAVAQLALLGEEGHGSMDMLFRVLKNIYQNPENEKYAKLRMNNAKIKSAIVDVGGGLEFLQAVGFDISFTDTDDGALEG